MTNGLLKSALHRVGSVEGRPMPQRYSLAYLMRPEDDTVLRGLDSPRIPPLEKTVHENDKVTSGDWIRQMFSALGVQENGATLGRILAGGGGCPGLRNWALSAAEPATKSAFRERASLHE